MNKEKKLQQLIKTNRTVVKGIRAFRELEEYVHEKGFGIKQLGFTDGPYIHVKIIISE